MSKSKCLIVSRLFPRVEPTRDVVTLTSSVDDETLERLKQQEIVEWIDCAEVVDCPETGVKTFDRIAAKDHIGTGNVVSNLLLSSHLRARHRRECNGQMNEVGKLQNFDLQGLEAYRLTRVINAIRKSPVFADNDGHWYLFRRGDGSKRVIYGALVTDANHDLVFRFDREDLGLGLNATGAARRILDAMELRVTSKAWQNRQRLYTRTAA